MTRASPIDDEHEVSCATGACPRCEPRDDGRAYRVATSTASSRHWPEPAAQRAPFLQRAWLHVLAAVVAVVGVQLLLAAVVFGLVGLVCTFASEWLGHWMKGCQSADALIRRELRALRETTR